MSITNVPTDVKISKTDEDGKLIPGALLQILDGKTVVEEWTSTDKAHEIMAELEAGKAVQEGEKGVL